MSIDTPMQPRRIARELALLSIGQLSANAQHTEAQEIEAAMTAAIRTLAGEIRDMIEMASADLNRSSDRLLESEIQAVDVASARAILKDAIATTQTAINRLGATLEFPEFIQIAQTPDIREFAYQLIRTCRQRRAELDQVLTEALVDWQLSRLAKIDRNILRLAVAEIHLLKTPKQVAINEAIELAKRYSTEDGHRFINGVLRRVTQKLDAPPSSKPGPPTTSQSSKGQPSTEQPSTKLEPLNDQGSSQEGSSQGISAPQASGQKLSTQEHGQV